MEVRDVRVTDSPLGKDRARLRAEVRYETGGVRSEEYWFDVPRAHAVDLSTSANPWVACLLPLVAHTGETLRIGLPVDRALLANADRIMRIWRAWYPALAGGSIQADAADSASDTSTRAAAFFSGGVDSFFTVLRRRDLAPPSERAPIDDLITVWGFDIPLERADAFAKLRDRHARIARDLGKHFIDVATNLRSTRWREAQWSYLAHGAGLAGVALSLGRRFHTVYVAGSGSYRIDRPWGSHVLTDPLFSSGRTAIVFDGAAYLRTEKIEYLAQCPAALRGLRVCYELASDENCGVCNKCLRTMVTLSLCGALERCPTFPSTEIDLERLAGMDASAFVDARELEDIRALAVARHRPEVVRAVDRSLGRLRRRRWIRTGLSTVRQSLSSLRRRVRKTR
jgi:hypothetical protein